MEFVYTKSINVYEAMKVTVQTSVTHSYERK